MTAILRLRTICAHVYSFFCLRLENSRRPDACRQEMETPTVSSPLRRCTDEVFNPRPASPSPTCHSLVDLLRTISPGFKRNFDSLLRRRAAKHPFERVPAPFQVHAWMSPVIAHMTDSIRKVRVGALRAVGCGFKGALFVGLLNCFGITSCEVK